MRINNNYKINNQASKRRIDENGFMCVEKSPILKAGVLEYLGSELIGEDNNKIIDGIEIEPNKVYKVFISDEELEKAKDTFKLIPIVNDHTWLGQDGENARDYQEGSTGEEIFVEDGFLYAPLKFTNLETIEQIQSGEKEELSSSYTNKFIKSETSDYDFIAVEIKANHLALVDKGRCGSDVRVLNSNNFKKEKKEMAKKKIKNDAKLIIDGKEIDLGQFFEQEEQEEVHEGTGAIEETNNEKEGQETKKEEQEIFNGDEVVKILEGLIKRIKGDKVENESDEKIEEKKEIENEDKTEKNEKDEKDEKKAKIQNYDAIYSKIYNSVKSDLKKETEEIIRTYNSVKSIIGDFNFAGMNKRDILAKGLNELGIETDKENASELEAMFKVCKKQKIDNGFSYNVSQGNEEIELNF